MLMSKSQLHPVMNPAAAGGKMIATYLPIISSAINNHNIKQITYKDEDNV